jgi:hypothetical protein
MNTQISFQLSDSQQEKYDEWMCAIHKNIWESMVL